MLREKVFDLVLMDVLTPQADGLETACVIRQNEATNERRLPIVGLMETDALEQREACLAAGMDACMPKSFDADNLYAVIGSLVPDKRDGGMMNGMDGSDPAFDTPIDLCEALRVVDGDIELLQDVIALFLDECPDRLSDLEEALVEQDAQDIERAAYRLKGILGNVGARVALSLAEQLEMMGENGRLNAWEDVWVELKLEITNVMQFVKSLEWEQATAWAKDRSAASLETTPQWTVR